MGRLDCEPSALALPARRPKSRCFARRSIHAQGVDVHRSRSGIIAGGVCRRTLPERERLAVERDAAAAEVVYRRSRNVYEGVLGDRVEIRAPTDDPLATGRASSESAATAGTSTQTQPTKNRRPVIWSAIF